MIINGDSTEELKHFPENHFDALVTDPPSGIGFMGKAWDTFSSRDSFIAGLQDIFQECLRTMKPGAHGLVWALPRTSHWTATALENAGFEVRDVIVHCYSTGFPKSLNVGKSIDKLLGAERTITIGPSYKVPNAKAVNPHFVATAEYWHAGLPAQIDYAPTAPATEESAKWEGWGSALKPASEHWILIRKPLSESSIARNVLKWGTGAINIEGSRIGTDPIFITKSGGKGDNFFHGGFDPEGKWEGAQRTGRFPANFILSHNPDCEEIGTREDKLDAGVGESLSKRNQVFSGIGYRKHSPTSTTIPIFKCSPGCQVAELDRQSGKSKSTINPGDGHLLDTNNQGWGFKSMPGGFTDSGGASRFFYCAKASKSDKNQGLESVKQGNIHNTVKPTTLMQYLIKLVCPPGSQYLVLDPFMGSGSTGVACVKSERGFVGIERESEYYQIAEARLAHAQKQKEGEQNKLWE